MATAASAPERIPDRVRLPLAFNPEPLVADLAAIAPEDWTRQPFKQNYEGGWDVVPLRSAAGEDEMIRLAIGGDYDLGGGWSVGGDVRAGFGSNERDLAGSVVLRLGF